VASGKGRALHKRGVVSWWAWSLVGAGAGLSDRACAQEGPGRGGRGHAAAVARGGTREKCGGSAAEGRGLWRAAWLERVGCKQREPPGSPDGGMGAGQARPMDPPCVCCPSCTSSPTPSTPPRRRVPGPETPAAWMSPRSQRGVVPGPGTGVSGRPG
jgi:hypothetical protein